MSKKRKKRKNAPTLNPNKAARMAANRDAAGNASAATPPAKPIEQAETAASAIVALDPLAPVIVRSGRPFDDQAGPDAPRFPPPSTVAGCLRTAWARETGQDLGLHLRKVAISGPLLLDRDNGLLVPKPADACYFGAPPSTVCMRAQPRAFDADSGADLPDELLPVQLTQKVEGKPAKGPQWWSLDDFLNFRRGKQVSFCHLSKRGWSPSPEGDRRTHVAIDRKRGAADEGRLFQTQGLMLEDKHAGDAAANGLRLLVRSDEALGPALAHLGGERRLAAIEPQASRVWPEPPRDWLESIAAARGLSLTLLTPGIFAEGYRPGWLNSKLIGTPPIAPDVRLQLRAVAIDRWQAHSGWDLAAKRPRPMRKLAPAGATYWFRILEGASSDALRPLWLANVSDEEQDRLDGFGLALPSAWRPPANQE